jgi:hypothetical protein
MAGVVLAASILALFVGGSIAPTHSTAHHADSPSAGASTSAPTTQPTPVATFNEDAPVDPASVPEPTAPATVAVATTAATDSSALALLAKLPVKPALSIAGYDRTGDFGAAWLDEDHNGCDTRNDILARDLTVITKSGSCTVMTGKLVSPYTGGLINFQRGVGTSALVQIDHVVALGNAWETGAQALSLAQRETLANDPLELLAVDGHSNDVKSDKDASEWLPGNVSFDCAYVARQISVKITYRLWVTPAEHSAMASVLSHCPNEKGTASEFAAAAPVSVPKQAAKPAVQPVAPKPAPKTGTSLPLVHAGAFCAAADAGNRGVTKTGRLEVCKRSATDSRLRWRAA